MNNCPPRGRQPSDHHGGQIVVAGQNVAFRDFLGTSVLFRFRTYKVIEQNKEDLELSDNPFAVIIITVMLAQEKEKYKDNEEELVKLSVDIARRMYRKGFDRKTIEHLLDFIKAYVNFGEPEINTKFDDEVDKLNNKTRTMGIREQITQIRIEETKESIVKNLLQKTNHSLQEIADLVDVSIDFVLEVKQQLDSE